MTYRRGLLTLIGILFVLLPMSLAAQGTKKSITAVAISIDNACHIIPGWEDVDLGTVVTWSTTDPNAANIYNVTFTNGNPFGTAITPISTGHNAQGTVTAGCSTPGGCYYPYTIQKNGNNCMGAAPPYNSYGLHVKPISTDAR
jgi:hypothetical protein